MADPDELTKKPRLRPEDTVDILRNAQAQGESPPIEIQRRLERAKEQGQQTPTERLEDIKNNPSPDAQIAAGGVRGATAQLEQIVQAGQKQEAAPAVSQTRPPSSIRPLPKRMSKIGKLGLFSAFGGLGAIRAPFGKTKNARTRLSEIHSYIGDENVESIPSLRRGAIAWNNILRSNPSLGNIPFPNRNAFAQWLSVNPGSGLTLGDYDNYQKNNTYQQLFPNGSSDEMLQQTMYVERLNDRRDMGDNPQRRGGHSSTQGIESIARMLKPNQIEKDRSFRRILKSVVQDYNLQNPNTAFDGKLIIKRNGDTIINPDLPREFVDQARMYYRTAYGKDELAIYDDMERQRVYKDPTNDPEYQKLRQSNVSPDEFDDFVDTHPEKAVSYAKKDEDLKKAVERAQKREKAVKKIYTNPSEDPQMQHLERRLERFQTEFEKADELYRFAENNPRKAQEYGKTDPRLQHASDAVQRSKQTEKAQRKIHRFMPSRDPFVQELRAGKLTPKEFIQKYPHKARAYRFRIKEIGDARRSYLNQNTPTENTILTSIRNRYPRRASDPLQKAAFEQEMNEFVQTNRQSKSRTNRQETDVQDAVDRVREARERARGSMGKKTKRRATQPVEKVSRSRMLRTWISKKYDDTKRKIRQASQQYITSQLRQKALSQLKPLFRALGHGLRMGTGKAVHAASRGIPRFANSLTSSRAFSPRIGFISKPPIPRVPFGGAFLASPHFWVAVLIIILAIFILLLIYILFFRGGDSDNIVSVNLTKSGPESVDNPVDGTPTEITYNFTTTYTGNPSSITIVDTLPPEVEFFEASHNGVHECNGEQCTVTWTFPLSGSGASEGAGNTTGEGCLKVSDPPGNDWAKINSLNNLFIEKVNEVNQTLGVCVPVNLIKALVYTESGGESLGANGAGSAGGYRGIMQVDPNSWCDHSKYDVNTDEGNVGCGVEHLAHTYQQCNNSWEGSVTAYYAGHCIPNGAADKPAEGGSGISDYGYRDNIINRWKELDAM